MNAITFAPLEIDRSRVRVAWTVEPATSLYHQDHFTLDFGEALDARTLPLKLWWTVVLLCMHSHWNLLRPCRVSLPIELPENEIEFWQRLLDLERASWELFRGTTDFARTIEIVCQGELLETGVLPAHGDRYATAFSGGKESLLQASLLCELTTQPLLVNVKSDLPPLLDHSTKKRARVLRDFARRRVCDVVEVKSDYRSSWDNLFGIRQGYRQTLNEFCDVPFYIANLLVVAAARGVRNIFIGTEFEAHQGSLEHEGHLVNYYQTMSPAWISALAAHLIKWDFTFGSLLWPLTNVVVERIIWTRYADLADLQYSCFQMQDENVSYCSRCRKCLRIALILLLWGIDPARLEIDVNELFPLHTEWNPNWPPIGGAVAYAAQHIVPARVRPFFPPRTLLQRVGLEEPAGYKALKKIVAFYHDTHDDWAGLYQAQFVKYIPTALRTKLDHIYRQTAVEEDGTDRSGEIAKLDATIEWLTEPLVKM